MDFNAELEAIQWVLKTDCTELIYVSRKQVQGLASLMGQEIKDRDTRIGVLDLLVGDFMYNVFNVIVKSTKNLTSPVASYLISQLRQPNSSPWKLSKHGKWLLENGKQRLQETVVQHT